MNNSQFHPILIRAASSKDTLPVLQRTHDDILAFLKSGNEETQLSSYNSYERLLYHQLSAFYALNSAPVFRGSTAIIIQRTNTISEQERAGRMEEMKMLLFQSHKSVAAQQNAEKEVRPAALPVANPTSAATPAGYLMPPNPLASMGPYAPAVDPLMQQFASLSMVPPPLPAAPSPGLYGPPGTMMPMQQPMQQYMMSMDPYGLPPALVANPYGAPPSIGQYGAAPGYLPGAPLMMPPVAAAPTGYGMQQAPLAVKVAGPGMGGMLGGNSLGLPGMQLLNPNPPLGQTGKPGSGGGAKKQGGARTAVGSRSGEAGAERRPHSLEGGNPASAMPGFDPAANLSTRSDTQSPGFQNLMNMNYTLAQQGDAGTGLTNPGLLNASPLMTGADMAPNAQAAALLGALAGTMSQQQSSPPSLTPADLNPSLS